MTSAIATPTVHLNGTSKAELLQGYLEAITALREASNKIGRAGPNARDYYVQGNDAFTKARDQHVARLTKLAEVQDELEQIAEKLAGVTR